MLPLRLRRLTQLLSRFPGVGEKTAQRFALFLAQAPELSEALGAELSSLQDAVGPCERCRGIAEREAAERDAAGQDTAPPLLCQICRDPRRDSKLLCVVSRIQDQIAIERSGAIRGRYFVLGRLLSPLDGVGPGDLPLELLLRRIEQDQVKEAIIATPPSVDGEATALLLAQELSKHGVVVSRIASGVPHGGDLEFADQVTLGRAITGRRNIEVR